MDFGKPNRPIFITDRDRSKDVPVRPNNCCGKHPLDHNAEVRFNLPKMVVKRKARGQTRTHGFDNRPIEAPADPNIIHFMQFPIMNSKMEEKLKNLRKKAEAPKTTKIDTSPSSVPNYHLSLPSASSGLNYNSRLRSPSSVLNYDSKYQIPSTALNYDSRFRSPSSVLNYDSRFRNPSSVLNYDSRYRNPSSVLNYDLRLQTKNNTKLQAGNPTGNKKYSISSLLTNTEFPEQQELVNFLRRQNTTPKLKKIKDNGCSYTVTSQDILTMREIIKATTTRIPKRKDEHSVVKIYDINGN